MSYHPAIHLETTDHLCGIVALWLYNHQAIDGANDTRYAFFRGDEIEAAEATRDLILAGLLVPVNAREERLPEDEWPDDLFELVRRVKPTERGIYAAMR